MRYIANGNLLCEEAVIVKTTLNFESWRMAQFHDPFVIGIDNKESFQIQKYNVDTDQFCWKVMNDAPIFNVVVLGNGNVLVGDTRRLTLYSSEGIIMVRMEGQYDFIAYGNDYFLRSQIHDPTAVDIFQNDGRYLENILLPIGITSISSSITSQNKCIFYSKYSQLLMLEHVYLKPTWTAIWPNIRYMAFSWQGDKIAFFYNGYFVILSAANGQMIDDWSATLPKYIRFSEHGNYLICMDDKKNIVRHPIRKIMVIQSLFHKQRTNQSLTKKLIWK